MSENIFDEYLFKDYHKAENTDEEENNNELLSQLYADIYYPSINEYELGPDVVSNAVPLSNCTINELSEQENIQYKLKDKAISEFKAIEEPEEPVAEVIVQAKGNNLVTLRTSNIAGPEEPIAEIIVQAKGNNLATLKTSNIAGKKKKKRSSKKQQLFKELNNKCWKKSEEKIITLDESDIELDMDTKYNVSQKKVKQEIQSYKTEKRISDNDTDCESIFEVPPPSRPKPLLIDLQDSDNEDAGSSIDEEDLLEGRLRGNKNAPKDNSGVSNSRASSSSPEVEIIEVLSNCQDKTADSTAINTLLLNKDTSVNKDISVNGRNTHIYKFNDIIMNCTMIQKSARRIDEIMHLSKGTKQNGRSMLNDDTSQRSKRPSQDMASGSNSTDIASTSHETCRTSQEGEIDTGTLTKKMRQDVNTNKINEPYNMVCSLKHAVQNLQNKLLEVSCNTTNNSMMSLKRHSEGNNEDNGESENNAGNSSVDKGSGEVKSNSPVRKRQRIPLTDQLKVVSTPQISGNKTIRNTLYWTNYFFKPLPQQLKNFYSDSRGQENFDISKLQRSMSRDPRMWKILDEDLMPRPAMKRGRYWNKYSYQRNDHLHKDCLEVSKQRCCMCGMKGHMQWRCPQQVCLTCGKKQNSYLQTCDYCSTLLCTMCSSVGHKKEHCPDLWRRYHLITKEINKPQRLHHVMKPASQLHCCNCTKRGHESSTCKEFRWSRHFPTPAFVTNYTEGPMYQMEVHFQRPFSSLIRLMDTENANVSSFKTKSNKMPNRQIHENTPVMKAQTKPYTDVGPSTSSACMETSEKMCTQKDTVMMLTEATILIFVNVIYCCGNFHDKKNSNARVLVSNLSNHQELSRSAKKFVQSKFSNNAVNPVFLRKLRKIVEFQIMIGLPTGKSEVMVQLVAPKECIYLLFRLLIHWLNLPFVEKQNGVNVNLPYNTNEMYQLLKNQDIRHFNKNNKNPMKHMKLLTKFQNKLVNMPKSKEYFHYQSCVWDIQTKLLAYIHSKPKPSAHFRNILLYIEALKSGTKTNQLDAATYLDILLSYNNVFTPHTPPNLQTTIKHIMQLQQNSEKKSVFIGEQLPSNADVNPSIPSATSTSFMSQKINIINPFAITNIQRMSEDISNIAETNFTEDINIQNMYENTSNIVETNFTENVDIYQPVISDAIENLMQPPQNCFLDVEPVLIDLENSEREDSQRSIDNVNINTNVQVTQQNVLTISTSNHSNNKKSGLQKRKKVLLKTKKQLKNERLYKEAKEFVDKAYAFKLPYMIKAAEDLQTKIKNKMLVYKHLDVLKRMVNMENKHQKKIKAYCNQMN
ncbi:uncharacterized protein LOC105183290 [Harpegnathos saltator]|uniref:Zinc finger CCHC domain-containing protein 7 n=1 Tax=Harpegnathos saltator TaxID=610380 RepID=E2BIU1_HARSA|nr:uncharacterized protein LOC105183290 [Harpegnathos saltator]EFN84373.1 Protein AIR2 [Harpegnathos saltator]